VVGATGPLSTPAWAAAQPVADAGQVIVVFAAKAMSPVSFVV
jgi:hypothetical protein